MKLNKSDNVGMIVVDNILTASVFNYYGINFYSKGNRTLEEVCIDDNISIVSLLDDLSQVGLPSPRVSDFRHMSTKELSSCIGKHHRRAERKLIFIDHTLTRIMIEYESEREVLRPFLIAFEDFSHCLTTAIHDKEFVIFPFLLEMESENVTSSFSAATIESVMVMKEGAKQRHEHLKVLAKAIRKCSIKNSNYNNCSIIYITMMELEEDLKILMHLENNILFPRVLDGRQQYQPEFELSQLK